MKRCFLISFILLLFISCKKEPLVLLSDHEIVALNKGISTSLTVTTNHPWSVTSPDWCAVYPNSGEKGEVSVTISVAENNTYDPRSGNITFTSEGISSSVYVTQEEARGFIVPNNSFELSCEAQEISVEVQANVEYDVIINAEWISQVGTKALSSKTYNFSIENNETYDSREGTIIIKERGGSLAQTITVRQAQKDVIILESSKYELSYEEQCLELNIKCNVEYSVHIPDTSSWISLIDTKGLVDGVITFRVAKNDSIGRRYTDVCIKGGENFDTIASFRVYQDGVFQIVYTTVNESVIDVEESKFDAKILSNTYENGKGFIIFDGGLTRIGKKAFEGCRSLSSIHIPNSVTHIDDEAFIYCNSLTSISLSENLTSIGSSAFSGCSSLTSIDIPESVTSIGHNVFSDCSSLTSIDIPDGVTLIGGFSGCSSLTSISLPENLTSIGGYAFSGCSSLTSINIPDGVTAIGYAAFSGCSSLVSISLPENLTSIGDYTFSGCSSLTSISLSKNLSSIGIDAFSGCSSLTSIDIPDGVTQIGGFSGCSSLTSIEIPESVTFIRARAFEGCSSLTSISLSENLTSIGDYAFWECSSITSIDIPDGVTAIGYAAFSGCSSLTSISLSKNLSSIGSSAFSGCSSLTSIDIPDGVTVIGNYAFDGCTSLSNIYCMPSTPPILEGIYAFYNNASDRKIHVKSTSLDAYKHARYWWEYGDYIVGDLE